jgi:hypothetical protein
MPNLRWSVLAGLLLAGLPAACDDAGDDTADDAEDAFEAGCAPGTVDRDGDPSNGCECVVAVEQCNGVDDDCDGATDDGDNGCGGVCPLDFAPGAPCDGPDTDPCEDDAYVCDGPAAVSCTTGDDSVETCNGVDDDCDGETDEAVCPQRVELFLLRDIAVCAVGNPCTAETCLALSDDAGTAQISFADDDLFRGLPPADPAVAAAPLSQCLRLTLDDAAAAAAQDAALAWISDVMLFTRGAIELEIVVHEIPFAEMTMSHWGPGLWVAPWDLEPLVEGEVTPASSFVVVTHGVRDAATGLHHDLGGCGGTYGADLGFGGTGYSWVPATSNAFWFECATSDVYMHEWQHQLHWALNELSGFDDLYDGVYPACGLGDPDPTKWFPDTHECNVDPDFPACGETDCGAGSTVNRHMLRVHWTAGRRLVGNHCRDGVRDFEETGVDAGGDCP